MGTNSEFQTDQPSVEEEAHWKKKAEDEETKADMDFEIIKDEKIQIKRKGESWAEADARMKKQETLSDWRIPMMGIKGEVGYYPEEKLLEFIKKCFIRMEERLKGNMIKYQDVVLIIKEEAGDPITKEVEK